MNNYRNYNMIVNCEFLDDDLFSKKIVEYYKNVIANSSEVSDRLIKIDVAMGRYVNDYNFSAKLRDTIDVTSFVNCKTDLSNQMLDYIVNFFDKYDNSIEETIDTTRWI